MRTEFCTSSHQTEGVGFCGQMLNKNLIIRALLPGDENRRLEQTVSHDRDREILSLQLVMQQIKMDNDNLKKQLISSKENSETFRFGVAYNSHKIVKMNFTGKKQNRIRTC